MWEEVVFSLYFSLIFSIIRHSIKLSHDSSPSYTHSHLLHRAIADHHVYSGLDVIPLLPASTYIAIVHFFFFFFFSSSLLWIRVQSTFFFCVRATNGNAYIERETSSLERGEIAARECRTNKKNGCSVVAVCRAMYRVKFNGRENCRGFEISNRPLTSELARADWYDRVLFVLFNMG